MKPANTTTNPRPVWEYQTIEDELTLCSVVRFLDLRAMHQSNGTDSALNDIIIGCYTDSIWSKADTRTTHADSLRTKAKAERTIANKARQTLNRVCIDEATKAEAERLLNHYTTLADNDMGEAHDTDKTTNALTATLAQDMLHHIWLELQAIKADPNRQTEKAFGELCKAGREYIQSMTAVSGLDRMTTISRPLTVAQAVELMKTYDINPGARPRQKWSQTAKGTSGYYTLEAKNRKRDTDPGTIAKAYIKTHKDSEDYKLPNGKTDNQRLKRDAEAHAEAHVKTTVANYARYNDMCVWYYENVTLTATHSGQHSYTLNDKGEAVDNMTAYSPAFPALDAKAIATRIWNRQTPAEKVASLGLDPADNPVLYLVLHIPTTRTNYSVEALTDHDPRTAETVTESATARIDIAALANRAKLTERERTAVEALTDPEAVAQARTAYNDSLTRSKASLEKLQSDRMTAGKKPYRPGQVKQLMKKAQATAENAYNTALWAYALTKAGFTESAQRQAKAHILKHMNNALHKAPDTVTPGVIDFARMMGNTYRGQAHRPGPRADYVSIWCKQAEEIHPHKPVILFAESGQEVVTMTPTEVEALTERERTRQAEHLTAHRENIAFLEYRRALRYAKPRTAWNALNATESALVFLDHLTTEEQSEVIRAMEAERKTHRDKVEAITEQAKADSQTHAEQWKNRQTVTITAKQWNAWTPAERLAHIQNTAQEGKRTEFA